MALLTITSPQILHLSSQLSLGVTIPSRYCLVTVLSREATGLWRLTPLTLSLDYGTMDLLCKLSKCLCLMFELGAIKISKAETTIKHQSPQSQKLPIWSMEVFPVWQLKGKNFGCGRQDDIIIGRSKTVTISPFQDLVALTCPVGRYFTAELQQGHHFTGRENKYLVCPGILNPYIKP